MVFLDFFYALRAAGLKSTLQEWRMLLTCLEKGLHKSTVEGFYHVARACLVKSESDFDTFDLVFAESQSAALFNHRRRGRRAGPLRPWRL